MSSVPLRLCLCTACVKVVDSSGNPGCYLNARERNIHKTKDEKAVKEQMVLESLQAIQRADDEDERWFASVPLDTAPPAAKSLPKYAIDYQRAAVLDAAEIQNECDRLRRELHQLEDHPPANSSQESLETGLAVIVAHISRVPPLRRDLTILRKSRRHTAAYATIDGALSDIDQSEGKLEAARVHWDLALRQWRNANTGQDVYDSDSHFAPILEHRDVILQIAAFVVVVCNVLLFFSRRGSGFVLAMCEALVTATMYRTLGGLGLSRADLDLKKNFPHDVPTVVKSFNLDAKSTVYAACPACHHTYKPVSDDSGLLTYPERCSYRRYGRGDICHEMLVRPQTVKLRTRYVPIKPFVSFDAEGWIAELLSRPGNEEKMDTIWEKTDEPVGPRIPMTDIFHGSLLRGFVGLDKVTHFKVPAERNEGRFVFALGFDFYNPLTNKQAGKKISVGMISVVCLNLPPEERYKPENMFLAGIIPGPKEPPLDTANSYFTPIVDFFEKLWYTGVRYTRTFLHAAGRLIRGALVAVICDLPAARKIGGSASCNHEHFCNVCTCQKHETRPGASEPVDVGYENIDVDEWTFHTNETIRVAAEKYRTADSNTRAQSYFDTTGFRWTELLRLPYFDPSKMIVVDSMHNLFLGLFKTHFRHILGFKLGDKMNPLDVPVIEFRITPDINNPFPQKPKEQASANKLINILKRPLTIRLRDPKTCATFANRWKKHHRAALVYVAQGLSLLELGRDPPTKEKLARLIATWRSTQQEAALDEENIDLVAGEVITQEEIHELWKDIEQTVRPSWVTTIPKRFGGADSDGKPKADQWRTIATMYMPVTLIRLWSASSNSPKRRQLLELTMDLVAAVLIATSRETSQNNADAYKVHMLVYRKQLKVLFPAFAAFPNHHFALHIPLYLRLFGPVHGWWTFPFERMIGMLERIPTNYKSGEYEATTGRTFHRLAKLRSMHSKATFPDALKTYKPIFDKLIGTQMRDSLTTGTVAVNVNNSGECVLPNLSARRTQRVSPAIINTFETFRVGIKIASLAQNVHSVSSVKIGGLSYSVRSRHAGNSNIIVKVLKTDVADDGIDDEDRFDLVPLTIDQIIHNPSDGGVFMVAHRYRNAHVVTDPYKKYKVLRARLWSSTISTHIDIVHPSMVFSHFLACSVDWEAQELTVVVPLARNLLVAPEYLPPPVGDMGGGSDNDDDDDMDET